MTDVSSPTHASRHATGGADAITPASIGAAAATHASRHASGGADAVTPAAIGAAPLASPAFTGSPTSNGKALVTTDDVRLGASPTFDTRLSLYNLTASSLERFRAARARGLGGSKTCRVTWVGDSITAGVGTTAPYWSNNGQVRLRQLFNNDGANGKVVEGFVFPTIAGSAWQDERWSQNSGNPGSAAGGAVSSGMLQTNDTSLIYTFNDTVHAWDKAEILYARAGISGTFNVKPGSGAAVLVSPGNAGANAVLSTTISAGSVGIRPVTFQAVTGFMMILGVRLYDSTQPTPALEVSQGAGVSGAKSSAVVFDDGNPWASLPFLTHAVNSDLTVLLIGTNDAFNSDTPAATYKANVETFIKRVRQTEQKDILLVTPPPVTGASWPALADMRLALRQLCDQYDVALLDLYHRWGGDSHYSTAPFNWGSDGLHPSDAGHWDMARCIYNVLTS